MLMRGRAGLETTQDERDKKAEVLLNECLRTRVTHDLNLEDARK